MKTIIDLEVRQCASSHKWYVLSKGLMDLDRPFDSEKEAIADMKRILRNKARRERHEMLTSLGLTRVKGSLGGTYYE